MSGPSPFLHSFSGVVHFCPQKKKEKEKQTFLQAPVTLLQSRQLKIDICKQITVFSDQHSSQSIFTNMLYLMFTQH